MNKIEKKLGMPLIAAIPFLALILLVVFVITANIYGLLTTELVDVNGIVHSRHVSTNRDRKRLYMTIIQTEDGWIQEVEGLSYYVLPVGSSMTIQRRK